MAALGGGGGGWGGLIAFTRGKKEGASGPNIGGGGPGCDFPLQSAKSGKNEATRDGEIKREESGWSSTRHLQRRGL